MRIPTPAKLLGATVLVPVLLASLFALGGSGTLDAGGPAVPHPHTVVVAADTSWGGGYQS